MRWLNVFLIALITISSGFGQLAIHACQDSGIYLAQTNCGDENSCCTPAEENADSGHCSTKFVYLLTAKFKDINPQTKFAIPFVFISNLLFQNKLKNVNPATNELYTKLIYLPPDFKCSQAFIGVYII